MLPQSFAALTQLKRLEMLGLMPSCNYRPLLALPSLECLRLEINRSHGDLPARFPWESTRLTRLDLFSRECEEAMLVRFSPSLYNRLNQAHNELTAL